MSNKTENQRIVEWNKERNLIKTPDDVDLINEISYIIEECIEMVTNKDSTQAREIAIDIAKTISHIAGDHVPSSAHIADSAADIKVFATGLIRKLGYDPDIVMHEVIQEIESRTGSIQDGKFIKDKSPEAKAKWYKADFSKADLL